MTARGALAGTACLVAVVIAFAAARPAVATEQKTDGKPQATAAVAVKLDHVPVFERVPASSTAHMVRLTMGRSKSIPVEQRPEAVTVDKPELLSVYISSSKTLNLLGRKQTGIAHFKVTGKDGKVVMERDVFIGDKQDRYVKIKDVCPATSGETCGKTVMYFCPDQCFEMKTPVPKKSEK
jgi:hypothetical protein